MDCDRLQLIEGCKKDWLLLRQRQAEIGPMTEEKGKL